MSKYKAIFLSDWQDNPYKKKLVENLVIKGIEVQEHQWKTWFIPLVLKSSSRILHLHTLHPFILGKNSFTQILKVLFFASQILVLNLIGIKVVWTVHEWKDKLKDGKNNISPLQAIIVGKVINAIITHCESTKKEIAIALRLKDTSKIFVIPHGNYIDSYENEISNQEARQALEIEPHKVVFLIFGSLYRYKGILEAIDAFKNLQNDEAILLIAGKSKERGLEQAILDRIKECENILFHSKRVPDEEIQIYMNACDIFLVPYKIFTTSGIAILGMSYGKACIVPNSGFFGDVFDNLGAFLYNPNSENDLMFQMKLAIEEQNKLVEMGNYNLRFVKQWSWRWVSEKTFDVYKFCLAN